MPVNAEDALKNVLTLELNEKDSLNLLRYFILYIFIWYFTFNFVSLFKI